MKCEQLIFVFSCLRAVTFVSGGEIQCTLVTQVDGLCVTIDHRFQNFGVSEQQSQTNTVFSNLTYKHKSFYGFQEQEPF